MNTPDPAAQKDNSDKPSLPQPMNAGDLISRYLDRWRQLTQLESQAIQRADWPELADLQTAKAALQRPLRAALDQWNARNRIAGAVEESEPFFRKTADRLMEMETQNVELLAARKQAVLERKRAIEQAARNLRLVRDSYAGKPANAWQVYS